MTFNTNKKILRQRESGQYIYENVFNFIQAPNNDESTDLNKATFSTQFVEKLIDIYVSQNSIILDCFMGTGTTAIGCINRNVNFIGFELSKAQCDYSNERIKKRVMQQTLFDKIDYSKDIFI